MRKIHHHPLKKPALWRWILIVVLIIALPMSLNYIRSRQIHYIATQPKVITPSIDYENPRSTNQS